MPKPIDHPTDKGTKLKSHQLFCLLHDISNEVEPEFPTDEAFWAHEEKIREAVNLALGVNQDYCKMYNAIGVILNDPGLNQALRRMDPKAFAQLQDAWPQKV